VLPKALQSLITYRTISGIVNSGHRLKKYVMHCQKSIFDTKIMVKIDVIFKLILNPTAKGFHFYGVTLTYADSAHFWILLS
jgi:hypothetical protein